MQVILLEKVANLGNLGDVVKVNDGFARNFLIPTRAARRATAGGDQGVREQARRAREGGRRKAAAAQALGEKMNGRTVHITQKAGVDGRLFGSVTNADIADALTRIDFKVAKAQVRMPNGPLKTVGEHTVTVVAAHRRGRRSQGRRARRDDLSATARSKGPVIRRSAALPPRGRGGLLWALLSAFPPRSTAVHSVAHRRARERGSMICRCLPSSPSVRAPPAVRPDDDVARLRVPPHSVEAEQSVLGGLLLDNSAWDRVGDLLTETDFYRYEHRLIYDGDRRPRQRDQAGRRDHRVRAAAEPRQGRRVRRPASTSTRWRRACRAPPTSAATPRSCASARCCASSSPRATRSRPTRSTRRAGRSRRSSTRPRARSSGSARKARASRQGFLSMDQLVVQLIDRVNELHENGAEEVTGVRTGFYDLDRMTAGLQPGDLIVLAARPSMGKTAFALNIAEHVAVQEGLPVVVFSMEMGASQLALRMVGSLGRIDQQHLRTGALRDDEWGRLRRRSRSSARSASTSTRAGADAERGARARAPPGAPVRPARPDRRRLPAADERQRRHQRREPRDRDRRDLARPEVARQGAEVPGDGAVAAQPQRRVAHRQAADDERPARVGRDRAGRRRHHVHLPRRVLHQGRLARSRASPRSSSASSATARPAPSS